MIRLPGYVAREHVVTVPLDHSRPDGATIEVFARELVDPAKQHEDLPYLLFLQGGPGGKSPRPVDRSGWIDVALRSHRVVLLDQRGTGRSTPITPTTAQDRPAQELADYLSLFRADAIVADAEILRRRLTGGARWDTLGQSYGGFVTLTYLSQAPEGLAHCYVTGGIPGVTATAEDVYARTFSRAQGRSHEYYARYPQDVAAVARLVDHLEEEQVRLPDGDVLTPHRLRTLGGVFGMSYGFETVHWLLDDAWAGGELHPSFLYDVQTRTGYVDNVLYALQEYSYGAGAATGWAAQREYDRRPEFASTARPVLLTAEMMFPWMFREIRSLRPFAAAADLLAAKDDWSPLYDVERLAANEVPLCAAVYYDDLYVDADLQLETLGRVGGSRAWVTNEHEHDGLRTAPVVLERLLDMGTGRC
ncbi:MAG TPA: alpha/beta fold hydrolase [Segeticoccus sp.]|uniref:alpha/beta fold hydrolase n=1 Tax=Segeticoccus sp. TaxID=2706531 RepID=UPI002D80DDDD|nr:alpha/beta fold hydrolase [Segeticoccus sp.]HET8598848.1 alpha/beta fold hydrolase [Segeticoccus sp.]